MSEFETDQSPSDPAPNRYQRFLSLGGLSLLVLGALIAFIGKAVAEDELAGQRLLFALGGVYSDPAPVDAAFGWMWFGVVLAVAGAILLTVWVSIRAAKEA